MSLYYRQTHDWISPENIANPLSGTFLYNFNFCCADLRADWTAVLVCFDLMFAEVEYSCLNRVLYCGNCPEAGMYKLIRLVPCPLMLDSQSSCSANSFICFLLILCSVLIVL